MAALDGDAEKLAFMNLTATGGAVVLPDVGASIDDAEKQHILGLFTFAAPETLGVTNVGYGFGTRLLTKGRMR